MTERIALPAGMTPRRGRATFRERDVRSAIKAVRATGHQVEHAEIDFRGDIVIQIKQPPARGPCVYVIEASPGSPVKIGFTKGLISARIKELQTGSHAPLRLITAAPAERKIESAIHRHLKSDRLTGEWFRRSNRVRRMIERIGRGDPFDDLLTDG